MKHFFYKIIFPSLGQCYVGIARHSGRYPKNRLGDRFFGPHHNVEVQLLLDNNEVAYWVPIKECQSFQEVKLIEDKFLDRVWKSGRLSSRPDWLLNRCGSGGGGFSGPHSKEARQKIGAASSKRTGPTGRQSLAAVSKRWDFDFQQLWDDIHSALNSSNGSYHWGGASIAKKHGCSRRYVAGIAKMIREGKSSQEWIPK